MQPAQLVGMYGCLDCVRKEVYTTVSFQNLAVLLSVVPSARPVRAGSIPNMSEQLSGKNTVLLVQENPKGEACLGNSMGGILCVRFQS